MSGLKREDYFNALAAALDRTVETDEERRQSIQALILAAVTATSGLSQNSLVCPTDLIKSTTDAYLEQLEGEFNVELGRVRK